MSDTVATINQSTQDESLVKEILSRLEQMKKIRQREESIWEDIAEIVAPQLSDITIDYEHETERRIAQNYDATGRDALRLWANGFQGYTTPRNSPWVKETLADHKLLEIRGVRRYLQERTEVITWQLQASNFYDALTGVLIAGGSVGTGGWTIDFDQYQRKLHYRNRHPKQVYIAENAMGRVDTAYIVEEYEWRQILQEFGEERLSGPDRENARRNPLARKKVLHACYPRHEKMVDGLRAATDKNYASIWILLGPNTLLRESGYDRIRDIFWRFSVYPGSPYGRGPSHNALIDLLRGEKMSETMMLAADLAVRPPMQYPAELEGKLNLNPHGMNPYYDPRRQIGQIMTTGNYPFGLDIQNDIREMIRRHYHIDFWLMLSQSQAGDRTAYEVAQLAGEKAAVMGAEVGRYGSEFLDPSLDTTAYILEQEGMMPDMPTEVQDKIAETRFSYDGPLAQLQKRHYGQMNVVQILNQVSLVTQMLPETVDYVDGDEVMKEALRRMDTPEDLIRSESDVRGIREQRNAMAAQERQLALAGQAAQLQATLAKAGQTPGRPGPPGAA
jgi:hypothetical protein